MGSVGSLYAPTWGSSAVLLRCRAVILRCGARCSERRYQRGSINKGRSPQNCIERGCVSVRPSDAILRDDGLICLIVAVGEQGAALPQASLSKGRFGGIVNISLIMIMKFHNHN